MAAANCNLDNFIAVVDKNNCQVDGETKDVMDLGDFPDKWRAFGWNVSECDGNDVDAVLEAVSGLVALKNGRPSVLIANTVKGKGVSFMEGNYRWHSGKLSEEQYMTGLKDLEGV